jgi:hypothetical protein
MLTHAKSRAGVFARVFLCAAILAAFISGTASAGVSTTTDPIGDAPKRNLTAEERRAVDIKSVTLSGDESLGMLATVRFAGNITKFIGRRHLRRARVQLVLQPTSTELAPARLATKGPGIIGDTVRRTRSRKAGVVRGGRALSFLIFGPGFSNLSTAAVHVLVPGGGGARALVRGGAPKVEFDTTGLIRVSQGDLSCTDLLDQLEGLVRFIELLKNAREKDKEALVKTREAITQHIRGHASALKGRLASLWYQLGLVEAPIEDFQASLAKLREAENRLEGWIKSLDNLIDGYEGQRQVLRAKLQNCGSGTPPPPPPPCSSTLERSPGGGNFTSTNHIRVRAMCDQPVTEIAVISLSGDTFDACAQTLGTATTCSSNGELLDTVWNAPANEQLEAYGRVTANADGTYRVRIRGAGAVVLHQYDATVPP